MIEVVAGVTVSLMDYVVTTLHHWYNRGDVMRIVPRFQPKLSKCFLDLLRVVERTAIQICVNCLHKHIDDALPPGVCQFFERQSDVAEIYGLRINQFPC